MHEMNHASDLCQSLELFMKPLVFVQTQIKSYW